ncbi:glycosyltransferase family 4 protein [Spirulina subsalsa]|uniref:glycosyltransferase family 4 protein n=1 Tax=Spirulina subsalsa TaxID=54311 RepID=UPI0002D3D274|nr:glycosyltransferase family 4 protein [Spirulina subsalsa]
MKAKQRVLIVVSHPVPYIIPLFRGMVEEGSLDPLVAYCSLQGVESYQDPEFGTEIAWDVPMLEGYDWINPPNVSPRPGIGRFWGLINPQLMDLVDQVDGVMVYAGYAYASFWLVALAAKLKGKPFLFSTDASSIAPRDRAPWKRWLKPLILPWIFRLGDVILVSSTYGKEMVENLGIPPQRVVLTPSATDNDWWLAQGAQVDREAVRQAWGIPEDGVVVLCAGKLQYWKRPHDILRAFAVANVPGSYLIYAGDGGLRGELEREAQELGVGDRVKFLGFVNQRELVGVYRGADLFCLCSEYEPFGVVVSEAMLCETAVVVSDQVGAREIVESGVNGFVYPCGDIDALAQVLREILPERDRLQTMAKAAQKRLETWSPRENVAAQIQAVQLAQSIRN